MTSLKVSILLLLITQAASHSYLISPKGNFKSFRKAECRMGGPAHEPNDRCQGPCISKSSWQYDHGIPTVSYKRGQQVTVVWARNNHHGGFIRFSIVPEHLRMNHDAHNRLAFHYSCFDSGSHDCTLDGCSADRFKIAFRATIRIPTIYPDGFTGVLAWSWFGGLDHRESFFGDYWSCRNIRIEGGEPLTPTFPIKFKADAGHAQYNFPALGTDSCLSSVDQVGICVREPCLGLDGTFMKPAPFFMTDFPLPITANDLQLPSSHPTATPTTYESAPSSKTPSPSSPLTPSPSLSPSTSLTPTATSTVTPSTTSTPSTSVQLSPSSTLSPTRTPSYSKSVAATVSSGVGSPSQQPAEVLVTKAKLVDIDTMEVIEDRFYRTTTIPTSTTRMTFVAETVGTTKFVKFALDGVALSTEMHRPYTAFGDVNGVYKKWPLPVYDHWVKLNVSATSPNNFMNYKVYWMRLLRADRNNRGR